MIRPGDRERLEADRDWLRSGDHPWAGSELLEELATARDLLLEEGRAELLEEGRAIARMSSEEVAR